MLTCSNSSYFSAKYQTGEKKFFLNTNVCHFIPNLILFWLFPITSVFWPVLWGPKRLLSLILINLADSDSSEKLQNVSHTKHIKDMLRNCRNL